MAAMAQFSAEHWVERVRRLLGGPPPQMQAAALPWRRKNDGVEILLVTSRDTGRWILPKGWPEAGEALYRAAEREAFEEAGIRGRISQTAIGSYMLGNGRAAGRAVEIFIFPLEVDFIAGEWPEMQQRERRWLGPGKAAKRVAEPSLTRLIRAFHGNAT